MLPHSIVVPPLPAIAVAVFAGATDPEVAAALELYREQEYDRAVVQLGRILAKSELEEDDRRSALETLGFAYTVLGDIANAELTFHALLDRHPTYAPSADLSPRIRDAYARAKSSWTEGRRIEFAITSPLFKKELTGELRGGDPRRVGGVSAQDELGGSVPIYCRARECRGERPDARFFIVLTDHAGNRLATSGPHTPELADDGLPWWAWAGMAAAFVGGGIALTLALSGSDEAPPLSLGRLQLP